MTRNSIGSPLTTAPSMPIHRPLADHSDSARWRDLIAELGAEIAHPLTVALERVNALSTSGQIDRSGLRLLRDEIETARRMGMTAQLLARFANAGLAQSRERVALIDAVESVLVHRKRETDVRGIAVQPPISAVDIIVDASLMFSLINTLIDWALVHAKSAIDCAIDVNQWTVHARLTCRFSLTTSDATSAPSIASPASLASLDTLTWRLLEQTASTMQLALARQVVDQTVTVTLEFALASDAHIEGVTSLDLDQGFDSSMNSKPLAGSHVVVIASRRDVRARIRDALKHMGLIVDMVASIDEATDFCRDGLPHAIIVEGILHGERFDRFCAEIRAEVPGFPFIDIVEEGKDFNVSDDSRLERARVGQDALEAALPSVLMFELSKIL